MGSVIRFERPVASLAVIKKLVDLGVKRDLWMLTTRRNCTASNHLISAHTLKNASSRSRVGVFSPIMNRWLRL
jgi:hypothetical protein